MNRGLTFRMGQTHVQKYLKLLLQKIIDGEIDPSAKDVLSKEVAYVLKEKMHFLKGNLILTEFPD